jgi:hypothetical protein
MARVGNVVFVPAQNSPAPNLKVDAIPLEIRMEAEEVYAALKTAGSGRMRVTFENETEVKEYAALMKAYCAARPASVEAVRAQFSATDHAEVIAGITTGGPLRFRATPTKGLDKNTMDFRIVDIPAEGDPTGTDAINAAMDKVKEAAKDDAPAEAPAPKTTRTRK